MMFHKKLAVASAIVAVAQALMVNTPASLITCQPVQISWINGAAAPYYIAIIPGNQVSAAALENLPSSQASPATWNVDLPAGTNVTIKMTDGQGNLGYSSSLIIQAGASTSCIGSSASGSTTASGSAAAGSGSAKSSATGTGSATTTTSGAASTSSKSAGFVSAQQGGLVTLLSLVAAGLGVFA